MFALSECGTYIITFELSLDSPKDELKLLVIDEISSTSTLFVCLQGSLSSLLELFIFLG